MQLVLPTNIYKESFIEAVREYQKETYKVNLRYANIDIAKVEKDFDTFVSEELEKAERKRENDIVPETVYWLIDNEEFIGRVIIRHELTEKLFKSGGNIGYDIRLSKRRMGYGKKILALVLPKAKERGMHKVLITCDESNLGSKAIIEANGGVFENSAEVKKGAPKRLRYWITLK